MGLVLSFEAPNSPKWILLMYIWPQSRHHLLHTWSLTYRCICMYVYVCIVCIYIYTYMCMPWLCVERCLPSGELATCSSEGLAMRLSKSPQGYT